MLEFRKDLFADERDDNLNEIGKPTQRQDMLGHVTGRTRFFDDHALRRPAASEVPAQPAPPCPHPLASTSRPPNARPASSAIIRAADVPVNLNTLLSLLNFGKDDEPSLAENKVRYKGEPVVAVIAESERAGARGAHAGPRRLRGAARTCLDVEEALKPGAPCRSTRPIPKTTSLSRAPTTTRSCASAMSRRLSHDADHVVEQRYQMSPIEHAPTETNGAIAAPETNDRFVCTPRRRRCSSRSARRRRS